MHDDLLLAYQVYVLCLTEPIVCSVSTLTVYWEFLLAEKLR